MTRTTLLIIMITFLFVQLATSQAIFNNNAGTELVRITENGKVGIGTSIPSRTLSVFSGDFGIFSQYGPQGQEYGVSMQLSNNNLLINTHLSGIYVRNPDIIFHNQSNLGRIGIGTSTPEAQLHTTGGVKLQGVAAAPENINYNKMLCMDDAGGVGWRYIIAPISRLQNGNSSNQEQQLIDTITTQSDLINNLTKRIEKLETAINNSASKK